MKREKWARIAVFYLMVLVTCCIAGITIASIKLPHQRGGHRPILLAVTGACVLVSYLSAYRPGWAYNYLLGPRPKD